MLASSVVVVKGSSKRTPLAIAVERQLDEEVKLLLAAGADHSIPDADTKWTGTSVAHDDSMLPITPTSWLTVDGSGAHCCPHWLRKHLQAAASAPSQHECTRR